MSECSSSDEDEIMVISNNNNSAATTIKDHGLGRVNNVKEQKVARDMKARGDPELLMKHDRLKQEYNALLNDFEKEMSLSNAKINKLENELTITHDQLKNAKNSYEAVQERKQAELDKELVRLRIQLNEVIEERNAALEIASKQTLANKETTDVFTKLTNESKQLSDQNEKLLKQLETLSSELVIHKSESADKQALSTEIFEFKQTIAELNNEKSRLKSQLEETRRLLGNEVEQNKAKCLLVDELKQRNQLMDQEVKTTKLSICQMDDEKRILKKLADEACAREKLACDQVEEYKNILLQKDTGLLSAKAELAKSEEYLTSLGDENESLQKDIENLREEVLIKSNTIKALTSSRDSPGDDSSLLPQQVVDQLEQSNYKLNTELTSLRLEFSKARREKDLLSSSLALERSKLEKAQSILMQKLKTIEEQMSSQKTQSKQLKENDERLQKIVQRLEGENSNLLSTNGSLTRKLMELERLASKEDICPRCDVIGARLEELHLEKAAERRELENQGRTLKATLEFVVEENERLKVEASTIRESYETKLNDLSETHELIMEKLYNAIQAEETEKNDFHIQHCQSGLIFTSDSSADHDHSH